MNSYNPKNFLYSKQLARCRFWEVMHQLRPMEIDKLGGAPLSAMRSFNEELIEKKYISGTRERRSSTRNLLAQYPKFFPEHVHDRTIFEDFLRAGQPPEDLHPVHDDDIMPMIGLFPRHLGDSPPCPNELQERLGTWLRAQNLDYPWCWNYALRQLHRWALRPEMAANREPHVPYVTAEPTTGSEILHMPLDTTGPSEVRWGGGPPARFLPPELQFNLSIQEGWAVHLGEEWDDAKVRLDTYYKEYLAAYKEHIMTVTSDWKSHAPLHFEYLVRRVVPPIESLRDISSYPPTRQPREFSVALAAFIGIKVIGQKAGRPRSSVRR